MHLADTLQLSVGNRCLIYQLAHTDYVPKKLRQFLMNSNHTFVGFWNSSDARKLMHSDHELEMWRDPLDLRYYVETDDGDSLVRASTEEIVEECLGFEGVRLEREISMSDWDDEYLSDDQVLQACLDAHCAFLIGKNCNAWSLSR
ncbi:Werner syndrome-like exonuclease-like protein [Quillaja saponaria]|uniref:Werner syndrome-like exonuclease-like protein n=1 Tax=Quillaja saponaria TaxID=32244 RepID=A0AAD7PHR6_QUISA|nr:Werner syndrome-like exonuclease-like protein [Quillaja saponaria]